MIGTNERRLGKESRGRCLSNKRDIFIHTEYDIKSRNPDNYIKPDRRRHGKFGKFYIIIEVWQSASPVENYNRIDVIR